MIFSFLSNSYLFYCLIILDTTSNIMPKNLVTAGVYDLLKSLLVKCQVFYHLASESGYLLEMDTLYH